MEHTESALGIHGEYSLLFLSRGPRPQESVALVPCWQRFRACAAEGGGAVATSPHRVEAEKGERE